MTSPTTELEDISALLRKVLNTHGHGFHYAVMRRVHELQSMNKTRWSLAGAEFPVKTNGSTTHIDFILQTWGSSLYLIAECKRADPARSRWCFTRAPYTWRNPSVEEAIFDKITKQEEKLISTACFGYTKRNICHLGFEIKTHNPGDGISPNGSAINQAVAQVLRGTSGLINHLFLHRSFSIERAIRFIPVIFTTAQLFVTDADLGSANITTGELAKDKVQVEKVDWIWFNHNRSPDLRHDLGWGSSERDLSNELRREFSRSVAIVGVDGIDAFLGADLEDWLTDD